MLAQVMLVPGIRYMSGPAVAEELPRLADFADEIEIQVGRQHFVFIARGLREDLAARIAKVARSVEFRRYSTGLPRPRG